MIFWWYTYWSQFGITTALLSPILCLKKKNMRGKSTQLDLIPPPPFISNKSISSCQCNLNNIPTFKEKINIDAWWKVSQKFFHFWNQAPSTSYETKARNKRHRSHHWPQSEQAWKTYNNFLIKKLRHMANFSADVVACTVTTNEPTNCQWFSPLSHLLLLLLPCFFYLCFCSKTLCPL